MKRDSKKNPIFEVLSYVQDKKQIAFSVILSLLSVIFGLLPYFAVSKLLILLIGKNLVTTDILWYGGMIFLGYWGKTVGHTVATGSSHKMAFGIMSKLRGMLTDKLLRLSMGKVGERSSGAYKQIIMDEIEHIEYPLAHMIPELTSNMFGFLLILVLSFSISWKMALASMGSLILGFVIYGMMMAGKDVMGMFRKYTNDSERMAGTMVEYVNGMEVIKAFGQTASSMKKFESAVISFKNSMNDWFKHCYPYLSGFYSATPASLLFVLPIGTILLSHGSISLESFILVMFLSLGLAEPLMKIMDFADHIMAITTMMGKVDEIMGTEELADGSEELGTVNLIEAEKLVFSYEDKEILHEVSFQIKKGESVAFVGPSGSGKSTIAKLMVRFYDPQSGRIQMDGVDIRKLSLDSLMRNISFVTQDNFLFNQSIMENIRIGNPNATDEMVMEAAKRASCDEFILSLPQKYGAVAGEAGDKLSGGQKQRIAIARAILKDASIVILDEATAFMDPENEDKVQESINELTKNRTLIVIAHRLSTVIHSDRIFVVNEGNIIASGTHGQLLQECDLYRKLWSLNQQDGQEANL